MEMTPNGEITIPLAIRQQLGLFPGVKIELNVVGDTLVLKKTQAHLSHPLIQQMRGKATTKLTTDEIMVLTRQEP